jgi:hypothetical protein
VVVVEHGDHVDHDVQPTQPGMLQTRCIENAPLQYAAVHTSYVSYMGTVVVVIGVVVVVVVDGPMTVTCKIPYFHTFQGRCKKHQHQ